ncbi:MAG TPA: S46 family peptidase [Bacteroidales bacterium]|nr:S46 family peptidase [Bacteroidales bacterium]HPR72703.1 S46 family peptidase [Bacteroidales bacterium]
MKKILTILVLFTFLFSWRAKADEGMWMLPLIEKLNIGKMTEMGLKLTAEDIYSLNQTSVKDAIVSIPGCTGEIVSSQGLLMTNHHCGYGSIQSHSTVEHDYLTDGFWAMTKEEELPCSGMYANFLVRIEDVTKQVMAEIKDDMSESERTSAINEARRKIEKNATSGNNYRVSVSSFFGGNYYYLLVYERYNDVRLVGAPPSSIGKYGNDTDNWEWPRHTGDFSIFRVYSGPDGKPASYSEDNIPLQAKNWLRVSLQERNIGDFTMTFGYPGRTQRYYTSYEVNELMTITNPNRVKIRGIKQDIWKNDMLKDRKINIQYASKYSSSSNYWKYSIGMNTQLERLDVIAEKQSIEEQFNSWIRSDEAKREKYGQAVNLIKRAIEGRAEYLNAQQYLSECIQGFELLGFNSFGSLLLTVLKSDDEKYVAQTISRTLGTLGEIYKDYSPATDRKSAKAMLRLYRDDVPEKFHPDFYAKIVDRKYKGDIDKFVDDIFDESLFANEDKLRTFLEKPSVKTLENDPVAEIAASINKMIDFVSSEISRFDEDLNKGRRLWIAALMEMSPEKTFYPDANSTMRLSYGSVQDYDPRDAVTYKHYTTIEGVLEKYKPGDYEFDLPERFIDLAQRKEFGRYASSEGYMPVCFLTTNDITGGNSGSPVLNGKGELIGLAFDGNWEAMSGDVAYEPTVQRTIAVDIRYVLWIIDIYSGAGHLIDEMTITK